MNSASRYDVSGSFPRLDFTPLNHGLIEWLLVTGVQRVDGLVESCLMSRTLAVPLGAAALSPLALRGRWCQLSFFDPPTKLRGAAVFFLCVRCFEGGSPPLGVTWLI